MLGILASSVACARPNTQLVVAVDSDYSVPTELSELHVRVLGDTEESLVVQSLPLGPSRALPLSFGVLPRSDGPELPVTIEVVGLGPQGEVLVTRRHTTHFIPGRALALPMFLARACAGETCAVAQTCSERGCTAEPIDPSVLAEIEPGDELSSLPEPAPPITPGDAGVADAPNPERRDAAVDGALPIDGSREAGTDPFDAGLADGDTADAAWTDAALADAEPVDAPLLRPSNLRPESCDLRGAPSLTVTATLALGTDGAACSTVVSQAGGAPEICVMLYRRFEVPAASGVEARGSRALAIVARELIVHGTIDVSGRRLDPGSGPATGIGGSTESRAGGGGGGYATLGAAGGDLVLEQINGGTAGRVYGSPSLIPLWPGSAGGVAYGWLGGQGGGAIELVGCERLEIGPTGVIDASGQGGEGGWVGGGGGSGGAILLEGRSVTVAPGATIVANGGGGGAGGSIDLMIQGSSGSDGRRGGQPALGGSSHGSGGGDGGDGGATGVAPATGLPNSDRYNAAGGGGGSVGRIRINTGTGQPLSMTARIVSPTPSVGTVTIR